MRHPDSIGILMYRGDEQTWASFPFADENRSAWFFMNALPTVGMTHDAQRILNLEVNDIGTNLSSRFVSAAELGNIIDEYKLMPYMVNSFYDYEDEQVTIPAFFVFASKPIVASHLAHNVLRWNRPWLTVHHNIKVFVNYSIPMADAILSMFQEYEVALENSTEEYVHLAEWEKNLLFNVEPNPDTLMVGKWEVNRVDMENHIAEKKKAAITSDYIDEDGMPY